MQGLLVSMNVPCWLAFYGFGVNAGGFCGAIGSTHLYFGYPDIEFGTCDLLCLRWWSLAHGVLYAGQRLSTGFRMGWVEGLQNLTSAASSRDFLVMVVVLFCVHPALFGTEGVTTDEQIP